ncbi:MAG: hypothetical protein Q9222_002298 [Ikaeria aurantiellina]
MYSRNLSCVLIHLTVSLAAILGSKRQLPSNASLSTIDPGNHLIRAYPPRPGWVMRVSDDLSIEVKDYGEYADPAAWPKIREGLDDLQRRMAYQSKAAVHVFENLISGPVEITLLTQTASTAHLYGKDVISVLDSIKNLFFVFKDKPRALELAIRRDNVAIADMQLSWTGWPLEWPSELPWRFRLNFRIKVLMEVYVYGRDVDSPQRFKDQIDVALAHIASGISLEGPMEDPVSENSYHNFPVKIDLQGPNPGKAKPELTRRQLQLIMTDILTIFTSWGPREFGGGLLWKNQNIGKIFITFTDIQSEIAQA